MYAVIAREKTFFINLSFSFTVIINVITYYNPTAHILYLKIYITLTQNYTLNKKSYTHTYINLCYQYYATSLVNQIAACYFCAYQSSFINAGDGI